MYLPLTKAYPAVVSGQKPNVKRQTYILINILSVTNTLKTINM